LQELFLETSNKCLQGDFYEEQNNFRNGRTFIFVFGNVSCRCDSENKRKFNYCAGRCTYSDDERTQKTKSAADGFAVCNAESVSRPNAGTERHSYPDAGTVRGTVTIAGTNRNTNGNAESVRFADTFSESFGNAVCDAESVKIADSESIRF